jgi:anti-sigma regulatory factor (Ser/Thr protein kinase)
MEALLTMTSGFAIEAADASHASAARLAVQRLARELDFDETRAGRAAIVVSEAVSNMVKHAGRGTLVVRAFEALGAAALEVLAIDAGPGMDVEASLRDGISTSGTAGTGLGAMRRLADEFDAYSAPGAGTIVRMVLASRDAPSQANNAYDVGAVCVPKPGETVSGDAWGMAEAADSFTLLVADGLGHGPDAGRAAESAVDVLRQHPQDSAIRILDRAHGRLRATRGAAVAVMRHERATGEVRFAGVGNIGAVVVHGATRQAMVSHSGIVGHNVHKSHEFAYTWPRGALVVAHSDGLETGWDLARFPGLDERHPSIIAAALFRAHSRRRDDVVVVVARLRH